MNNPIRELCRKVDDWARNNAQDDFWYGSRQSYWAAALRNKIVTNEQYDSAADYYGNLWTYRGD